MDWDLNRDLSQDLNQDLHQRQAGPSPFELPSWDSGTQAQGDAYHIGRAPPGGSSAFGTCLCTVVFFQLPTSPPTKKHVDGDPTIHLHVCHPCIDMDRPAIDATDTAVDQGASPLRASHSRVLEACCAVASAGRHATPPPPAARENA